MANTIFIDTFTGRSIIANTVGSEDPPTSTFAAFSSPIHNLTAHVIRYSPHKHTIPFFEDKSNHTYNTFSIWQHNRTIRSHLHTLAQHSHVARFTLMAAGYLRIGRVEQTVRDGLIDRVALVELEVVIRRASEAETLAIGLKAVGREG